MASSLPSSSSLRGAGAQFASQIPQDASLRDDEVVSQQQPTLTSYYPQPEPAPEIAYSNYGYVPTQQQSYGYSSDQQQQYNYPQMATADYVTTPAGLVNQFSGLQISPSTNQSIQYGAGAAIRGQYQNATSNFSSVNTGQGNPSTNYTGQQGQGEVMRSSRTRSHGTATNFRVQNEGIVDRRARQLLGKEGKGKIAHSFRYFADFGQIS